MINKHKGIKFQKFILPVLFITFLIILDQTSKNQIIEFLGDRSFEEYALTPFLKIVHAWNYGISFGLFRNYYQYSNYTLLTLNIIITLYLCKILFSKISCSLKLSLSLIIGGAIGNLLDRILKGAVFDFIYFSYEEYHFPAFNLADSFITVGAIVYIITMIREKK